MKKILLFLLVLTSLVLVTSCGNNEDDKKTETPVSSEIQKVLDEAKSLQDGEALEGERSLTGTVGSILGAYSEATKTISFILTDNVAEIMVFNAKGACAETLKENDTVTVTGLVYNFEGLIEFKDATLKMSGEEGNEDELPTIKSILDEAANLGDGEKLEGTRKTVGTIKEITEAYTTQYKNISFMLEDATGTIKVFRAKGNCAAYLKVGDTVYVEGNVTKFGTSIEFEYATLKTGNELDNEPSQKVDLSTVAEVLEAAKDLEKDGVLPTQYKVTGTVSNFKENFSYSGGNYYSFDLTDETGKIYIYAPVGTILETLKDGETVFVKGNVKNYKDTIEFDGATVSYADDFDKTNVEKLTAEEKTPVIPSEVKGTYEFISLPMAIAIARDGGENFTSTDKYYITGWVSNVSNASFGELTITDGNVSIYAYGISNYTSGDGYPLLGDVVVLEAVLGTKGTDVELKNATKLVEWHDVKVDETKYTASTIVEARNAEAGSKLIVEGVVAGFTYKNAKTSSGEYVADGLYLVNGTDSIYVFGVDLCSVVKVGNTIKIAGVKEFFVQSSEVDLAEKYGFAGACQLSSVELIENKGGNTDVLANSFEKTTIKNLMENNYDANITTQIYEVNALIRKVPGNGFVNYYINDLDGTTGTYTYTKCNGNDFAWIDSYLNADGEYLCTLLVTVCNAKATASGCNWRMVPLKFLAPFTFDKANTAEFVLEYFVLAEFDEVYYANPETELITTHASELLGYEGVTVSYSSDNESVVKFTDAADKKVLNVLALGEANVTITVNYNGTTATKTIKVVRAGEPVFEALTVKEAINTPKGEEVTVMGIVAGGVANQKTGFYLIDETGVIAVKMLDADQLAKVAQGNKVVIKGKREQYKQTDTLPGQTSIVDAELVHNYFGEHEYSTATFQESSLLTISKYPAQTDYTTQVYIIEASYYAQGYTVLLKNGQDSIALYCSGSGQYAWLASYATDKVLKMEVALCNWNNKDTYKAYVLAVYLEDGTKVVNPTNFAS